jgi:hydrogenase maturation protein HypF
VNASHHTNPPIRRYRLLAHGRVQGVGFRPTFYRELTRRGCGGSIRNTPEGVVLEVEGPADVLDAFVRDFRRIAPERARVDELTVEEVEPRGETEFRIEPSRADGPSLLPIPPDLATCAECLRELHDPDCRRRGYAFDTCTACGPRFTIARQVPFDRDRSSMDQFPPCPDCGREYADPADRRMHAVTISCPTCGPSLSFLTPDGGPLDGDPIERTQRMLRDGAILAVKGVGGFHLACDATRETVVARLRERKRRPAKPLAIMVPDLSACERMCIVPEFERSLLSSPQAPIVLLRKRPDCPVADAVAPGLYELGVMLPYTPLHVLLFDDPAVPRALVMTSCNRSEEPIAIAHEHVADELADLVDGILTNDRPITNRCDDSLVAAFSGQPLPMRRSRGYVPEPIELTDGGPSVLATGGMLKNAFALTSGRRAFLSQHIGDVSDADNALYFARSVERFCALLRLEPEVVACDMHPDYPTTAYARELAEARGLPLVAVQQHHAHVVSCLAEHGRDGPVIGVSWDGSGYGDDEAVWGGEFLLCDRRGYERRYHLDYVRMPGGERAVQQPWRMALSHLANALGPEAALARMRRHVGERELTLALRAMELREFSPPTSSAGRLFDAVAALLGVRLEATYEGQAACELEARAADSTGCYGFGYDGGRITLAETFDGLCRDLDGGEGPAVIAGRFHATMARLIVETCRRLRDETGMETAALSGGVMQNRTLLGLAVPALEADGFEVLLQTRVPPNDGGLCLGQAACALARLSTEGI